MTRITAAAYFTLASIFSVGSTDAQVRHREVRATVPFDFMVGSKQLPAGTYSIVKAPDETIQIRNLNASVMAIVLGSQNGSLPVGCVLDFAQHGSKNFLRAVLCDSAAISIDFPISRLEQSARSEEANLHEASKEVQVAAR